KIDQVAAGAAPRIEDAHPRRDAPAQKLVEEVDVDRTELFWKAGHGYIQIVRDHARTLSRSPGRAFLLTSHRDHGRLLYTAYRRWHGGKQIGYSSGHARSDGIEDPGRNGAAARIRHR